MKNLFIKYTLTLLSLFSVAMMPTSCIEDSESAVSGQGQNRFRAAAPGGLSLAVYADEAGTFPLVEIWRDVTSSSGLNSAAQVEFEIDNTILTAYNANNPVTEMDFTAPSVDAVSVEGSSVAYVAGDFSKPIMINLNPSALNLGQRNALGIRLKNPSDGYGISGVTENGEFITEIIVKNKYDGIYKYTGHIGRYDGSCALIELGGDVVPGVTVSLSTTGLNSVSTVLLWNTGSVIGGIGASQTITIDPVTNAVTLTANGVAAPANWAPIDGQPNYYDPATGDIYVSQRWSAACGGADYGYIRHVRVKLTPK